MAEQRNKSLDDDLEEVERRGEIGGPEPKEIEKPGEEKAADPKPGKAS